MATTPGGTIRSPPNPLLQRMSRHGSSEQVGRDVFGREASYLNSVTPPRSPRNRSPQENDADYDDRRDDRRERYAGRHRARSQHNHESPIGTNFRILAVERTLREHTNEIAGQKLLLGEVVKNVEARVDADKILNSRLDVSFDQTKAKIEEIDKRRETDQMEVKSMMSAMAAKVEQIAQEHNILVKMMVTPPGTQNNAPPGTQHDSQPTWSGPQSPPPRTLKFQIGSPLDGAAPAPDPSQSRNFVPDSGPNFGLGNNAFTAQPPIGQNNMHGNNYAAQDASFGRWAPGAGTQLKPFEEREWSTGHKKVTKQLDAFDGDIVHYDNWRRRIRDHFIDVNCNYAEVFRLIENEKGIISWARLPYMKIQSLPHMNWQWIASHLWSFMGQYMTDNVLNDRLVHTCGEEFNGLELW